MTCCFFQRKLLLLSGLQFVNTQSLELRIFGKTIESFTLGVLGEDIYSLNNIPYNNYFSFNSTIPGISSDFPSLAVKKQTRIEFGMSNEEVDAGQSFVPYFDGNDVTMDVKSPLSGLGFLHYTKNESFSGYVKPYLITLNYYNFVSDLDLKDLANPKILNEQSKAYACRIKLPFIVYWIFIILLKFF